VKHGEMDSDIEKDQDDISDEAPPSIENHPNGAHRLTDKKQNVVNGSDWRTIKVLSVIR
jgi:hypothetical protein